MNGRSSERLLRGSGGVGVSYWPRTRLHRQGIAGVRNLRMRRIFGRIAPPLAIFFVFAIAYVWTRVQVVEAGYRLRHLEVEREKLKEENRSLAVEAAMLRSPQRLERIAAGMGLKRPNEKQVYFLKP